MFFLIILLTSYQVSSSITVTFAQQSPHFEAISGMLGSSSVDVIHGTIENTKSHYPFSFRTSSNNRKAAIKCGPYNFLGIRGTIAHYTTINGKRSYTYSEAYYAIFSRDSYKYTCDEGDCDFFTSVEWENDGTPFNSDFVDEEELEICD